MTFWHCLSLLLSGGLSAQIRFLYPTTKDIYLYKGQRGIFYRYSTHDFSDMNNDGVPTIVTYALAADSADRCWVSLNSMFQAAVELVPPQGPFDFFDGKPRAASAISVDATNLIVGSSYRFDVKSCSEIPSGGGIGLRVCVDIPNRICHIIPVNINIMAANSATGSNSRVTIMWKTPNFKFWDLARYAVFERDDDSVRIGGLDSALAILPGLALTDTAVVINGNPAADGYFAVIGYDSAGEPVAMSDNVKAQKRSHAFSLDFPADGSVLRTTLPAFRWGSVPGSRITYDLWLSADSMFLQKTVFTNLADTTANIPLPLTDHKTYFWKVRASTAGFSDQTGWRFGINVNNVPPGTFNLLQPRDGDTLADRQPLFRWEPSPDGGDTVRYRVDLSMDPGFSDIVLSATTRLPFFWPAHPIGNMGAYYWRVTAIDGGGAMTASNEQSSFRLEYPEPPSGFNLIYPRWNTETVQHEYPVETGLYPTFQWTPSFDATSSTPVQYTLYYDTTALFGNPTIVSGLTDATYTPVDSLVEDRQYFWKVAATAANGMSRWNYGLPYSFITNSRQRNPDPAILLQPPTDTVISSDSVAFLWLNPADDLTDYHFFDLYISTDTVFADTPYVRGIFATNTDTLAGLPPGNYYWKIVTRSQTVLGSYGGASVSARRSFTLRAPLGVRPLPDGIPDAFTLEQNYPNPFNPATEILYGLPGRSLVRLDVFNVLGECVASREEGVKDAGWHRAVWKASNQPSGMYFYRVLIQETVAGGTFIKTGKMILLR